MNINIPKSVCSQKACLFLPAAPVIYRFTPFLKIAFHLSPSGTFWLSGNFKYDAAIKKKHI